MNTAGMQTSLVQCTPETKQNQQDVGQQLQLINCFTVFKTQCAPKFCMGGAQACVSPCVLPCPMPKWHSAAPAPSFVTTAKMLPPLPHHCQSKTSQKVPQQHSDEPISVRKTVVKYQIYSSLLLLAELAKNGFTSPKNRYAHFVTILSAGWTTKCEIVHVTNSKQSLILQY